MCGYSCGCQRNLAGVSSLLPPHESQGSNSSCWSWQPPPSPSTPCCWPSFHSSLIILPQPLNWESAWLSCLLAAFSPFEKGRKMEARASQERPALHHRAAPPDPESFCVCFNICICMLGVEIRGQLAEVDSLLPPVDSRDLPQVNRRGVVSTFSLRPTGLV